MCIVCILFLLAVHRLVLIVNSWDVLSGGGNGRGEGKKVVPPLTTETVFCSGLMNPSLFVFFVCFICIFPELERLKGECSAKWKDEKS